jgi:hypothetical protein
MAGGTGVMLGLGELGEDGAEVGVEGGVDGGRELVVGCAVADARLLGLTVMLQPPSVTTTTQAAASRTRRMDLASGISTILVGGVHRNNCSRAAELNRHPAC